ncbi:N-formylglutamate amidohydrolase [Chachezhania sediminis]|uniref:N-formylglutamate amidohydrolase n=1 Tax=Chachezhania sediminis TaxID=2599291 RepID=UPI00131ECCA4|nr:N-formylglutamate amidohydrolase [Chachezhania sediminis]
MTASPLLAPSLLGPTDPPAVQVQSPGADSPFLFVCDHAGLAVPQALGTLGLPHKDLERHIGWDIGARTIAEELGQIFGATVIASTYSRLVYDLNRYPWDPFAMTALADGTAIPGNAALTQVHRERRYQEIARPYHDTIAAEIDARLSRGRPPILISVHTMTDRMKGGAFRDQAYAVLSTQDPVSQSFLAALRSRTDLCVGDNVPYALDIDIDYTVPEHAIRRGLPSIMFEVRQDLVTDLATAAKHAGVIARALRKTDFAARG